MLKACDLEADKAIMARSNAHCCAEMACRFISAPFNPTRGGVCRCDGSRDPQIMSSTFPSAFMIMSCRHQGGQAALRSPFQSRTLILGCHGRSRQECLTCFR